MLEKCIKEFREDSKVHQDERYLDVWIKYASLSQNALEIFQFMSAQGVCTCLPNLYVHWAWELEQATNFKKAEQIFVQGLAAVDNTEAKETLEYKHKQFQV